MSDRDLLAGRFAAFREASVAATECPGVAEVRRAVARRDLTRTIVVGIIVALAAGTGLWLTRMTTMPAPSELPSAAPSTVASTGSPSPTARPGPSGSRAGTSDSHKPATCPARKPGEPEVLATDPLTLVDNTYFQRCPEARIRIYGATYEWDARGQRYTLAHLDNAYLTATSPSRPVPAPNLDPSASVCGYGFVVVESDSDPPSVLPLAFTDAPTFTYWSQHNYPHAIEQEWHTRSASELAQTSVCRQ
jgi:hypothetical protein